MTSRPAESSEGVTDSRFYMWRAVFAMAHADHVVTEEERAFMEGYLASVPFSPEQEKVLRTDMAEPQNPGDMFFRITEPEDQGQFFQFARELVWCDGDFAAQEEAIKDKMEAYQMGRVNLGRLELELKKSRAAAKMEDRVELRRNEKRAGEILGLGSFIRKMVRRGNRV